MQGSLPGDRLVVFIDILGFRHLVGRMFGGDVELFEHVLELLRKIKQSRGYRPSTHSGRLRSIISALPLPEAPKVDMLAFSDTVVFTAKPEPRAVRLALQDAGRLMLQLLEAGIPTRGGAVIAPCHVESGIIFGPGMIDAYDLESKHAAYPRLLVEQRVVETLGDEPYPVQIETDDCDGGRFLDLLSLLEGAPGSADRRQALARLEVVVGSMVRDAETTQHPGERLKRVGRMRWLHRRVQRALDEKGRP